MMRTSLPLLSLLLIGSLAVPAATAVAAPALTGLDVSSGNRRAPVSGLYDWSKAGYRGNGVLPGNNEVNPSAACQITAAELASQYSVRPDDAADDTAGLQAAIDAIRTQCSPSASYTKLSTITLPAGQLKVTKQLSTGGSYDAFYSEKSRIYQFGWNGSAYQHLDVGGAPIADWAKNEQRDYTGGHGVDATKTDSAKSLFLKNIPATFAAGSTEDNFGARATIPVSNADQLRAALTNARAGDVIQLAAGTYRGAFVSQKAGTSSNPITLTGPSSAVLVNDGPSGTAPTPCPVPTAGWDSGYGLWLYNAPYWNIKGITVAESKKGIVLDKSDRVQVLNNRIGPGVSAEHIDVKEGTQGGLISGNTFNGTGISGANSADSWIDVKGFDYRIENNTGTFASPGTFANGYETHNPSTTPAFGNGCGNVWRGNRSDLGDVGDYAVYVSSTSKCKANPNVVHASNTATRAKKGVSNIPVTP